MTAPSPVGQDAGQFAAVGLPLAPAVGNGAERSCQPGSHLGDLAAEWGQIGWQGRGSASPEGAGARRPAIAGRLGHGVACAAFAADQDQGVPGLDRRGI